MRAGEQHYPLSAPQKGIWYTEKFYQGTSITGISATMRLKAPIEFTLLEQAINYMIENNDSMRLRVAVVNNEPRQYVEPYTYRDLEIKDFTTAGENAFSDWESITARKSFFAENADLFYCVLLLIDEDTCGFFFMLHHLIADAWSMVLLGDEVMSNYMQLLHGRADRKQKPSYLRYLESEETYFNSERYKKDAAFWQEQFVSLPELVGIKTRKTRDTGAYAGAARNTYELPARLCDKIREYSAQTGVSGFIIFLSSFFVYLNRITGCDDAVIGVPILGRHNARDKETAGMFVSVAPFRLSMDSDDSFDGFAGDLSDRLMRLLRHHRYPMDEILRDVRNRFGNVERIYDIVFSYQNARFEQTEDTPYLASYWHFSGTQSESLAIHINNREGGDQITINYDYLTDLFDSKDVDALHDHYIRLLWHALDSPQKRINMIEMVSEKEKELLLDTFNNTASGFPEDCTMLDFYENSAARAPDAVALLFGGDSLTYRELDARANALAWQLQRIGTKHGDIIAMMLRRSFEMMIGILAIWKAGGAYLPVDPDYPEERVIYMLEDGGARILLTTSAVTMQPEFHGETIQIDRILPDYGERPPVSLTPDDIAYVLYTSGSTGKAKGVMVGHRALVNRVNWMNRKYPLGPDDIILQKTTYTFDVSVWELVWWFYAGVKLVFLEPEAEKYPDRLIDAIAAHKITTLHFVPSMLSAFLGFVDSQKGAGRLVTLRNVFASGEALTPHHVNRFNSLIGAVSGARLYNLYGPTEAAIDVTYYDCPAEPDQRVVPIGKPIDNIQMYILDQYMNVQPITAPGELCIGGVGLARGYINKPELTAEKFVPNPFTPGTRLYKTGDLARWFPKGDIEYLGRIDRQIKIRGFRVELGDIKYHLEQLPSIEEAVVLCLDSARGDKYLAAYYVSDTEPSTSMLRDFLSKRLPEYMIPSYFIRMERIPLFSNGKANTALLPEPSGTPEEAPKREIIAPRNEMETLILRIWSEVLGKSGLSVTDNFFELGGDSITAIDMICRLPAPVNVSHLYEHPVLEDFARVTDEKDNGSVLTLLAGKSGAELNYILCPYGGGGAYSYLDLACCLAAADPGCCVYSLSLPGHDFGAGSSGFLPVRDTAELAYQEALTRINGRIVVYAHCVGAAHGVELTRLFEQGGADIEALYIGGILPSPHVGAYGWFFDPWMFVGDAQLLKYLNTMGLAAENPDRKIIRVLLRAFRHDVRCYYRYFSQFIHGSEKKLSIPVHTVLGESDRMTNRKKKPPGWVSVSNAPAGSLNTIEEADHYFVKTHAEILAGLLTQRSGGR